MRLIDTHCHLYLEDFDPEQDELAQKAKDSGNRHPASAKRRPDDD
mgnify:CR=1 FL=1